MVAEGQRVSRKKLATGIRKIRNMGYQYQAVTGATEANSGWIAVEHGESISKPVHVPREDLVDANERASFRSSEWFLQC
jgi:hypothetical protein